MEFAYYKDGDRVVKKMTSVENRFEYILPFEINSEMFNSNFEIIAYDKYGKESKFIPSIKDEAGNSTDKYFSSINIFNYFYTINKYFYIPDS